MTVATHISMLTGSCNLSGLASVPVFAQEPIHDRHHYPWQEAYFEQLSLCGRVGQILHLADYTTHELTMWRLDLTKATFT